MGRDKPLDCYFHIYQACLNRFLPCMCETIFFSGALTKKVDILVYHSKSNKHFLHYLTDYHFYRISFCRLEPT